MKNAHCPVHCITPGFTCTPAVWREVCEFVVLGACRDTEAMEIPLLYDVRLKVCSQRKSTIQPGQLGIIAPRLSDPEPLFSTAGWDG